MYLSHNVLIIESISSIPEHDENIIRYRSEMNAKIKFHCSKNGNHFASLIIVSDGNGYSTNEAIKSAIQNFLNGNFYSERRIYDRETESYTCKNISHIDIQVGEPFKSLFEQLFDMQNWEIPKHELTA